jgi:UDP-N-acetylmuramoyl-L-alanyl-D-glutamate--2,6-diaminopimelate ligase
VTSDNPRTEDPLAIIDDIVSGMAEGEGRYEVIRERREAIARALSLAQAGDSVLIAGKGHEDYQIIGKEKIHMDEREIVADVIRERAGRKQTEEGTDK